MIDYTSDPFFWQRFLKCAGFYTGIIDGDFGKNSLKAAHEFELASIAAANELGSFDGRSEGNIQMLLPAAQRKAREFMKAAATGTPASAVVKIISGTRTFAEQDILYAQGRTRPGKKVTNAKGGQSNHNFGVAWDIGIFKNGQYLDDSPLYANTGAIGESLGLEWGGHWKSIQDEPHFQVVPDSRLKAIAAKFQNGEAFI
jgi:peptidoglycan L-alanyl-D-glutamate endopeptidase CwlK